MDFSYSATAERSSTRVRELFVQIYAWMTAGLLTTAAVAQFTASSDAMLALIYGNPFTIWILFILQIGLVMGISAAVWRLSAGVGMALFLAYAAFNGLTLSSIVRVYTEASIALAFFVTAGTFAAMSAFGYLTKMDLSRIRSILYMALIGLVIASVANFFFASSALYWIISYVGVLIFVGLTAADTQKIKQLAIEHGEANSGRVAVLGALTLYLDFINLFLFLLRILGGRRN
ncbi:MAG: Bax inhibitor-1/YccA family protein [Roseiflexaceae bacterium]|nr:Bax inhibitor-1/YccA family protein [Roseiflexaceae bacterium]